MHIAFKSGEAADQPFNQLVHKYWPETHHTFQPTNITHPDNSGKSPEVGIIAWCLTEGYGQATLSLHAEEPNLCIMSDGIVLADFGKLTLRYTAGETNVSQPLTLSELLNPARFEPALLRLRANIMQQTAASA